MAGIYLHIPFCQKACIYCDFHFSTLLKKKEAITEAIVKELKLRRAYLENKPVETIYFGGGTPTLLKHSQFERIFDEIFKEFKVIEFPEITVEANPDDITADKLNSLKSFGVNRLSIGVQSFFDEHLKFFNRSHNSNQAFNAVKTAQNLGIDNITLDLIYGFPQLTENQLEENLNKIDSLQVPHVSTYSLTVEPKTALHHLISKGKAPNLDDEVAAKHFELVRNFLKTKGFHHYEISNFGKPQFYSNHNSNYWLGKPYLGVGPSAHSYNLNTRSWNVANNSSYLKQLAANKLPHQEETLSTKDKFNEFILTGLRTKWGITFEGLQKFPQQMAEAFQRELNPLLSKSVLLKKEKGYVLNDEYWFKADGIAAELFQV